MTKVFPSYGLILVILNLLLLALAAPYVGTTRWGWIFLWNGLCMGTVMGVVQVTVQSASGPQMLGEAAASVQFSRSIGAAFGTATVASVLFAVLSATDRGTAALFARRERLGLGPPVRQATVQSDIAEAFRVAFLVIAGFTGAGALFAMSIPLRRI